jgi:hypothetical protein
MTIDMGAARMMTAPPPQNPSDGQAVWALMRRVIEDER